MGKFQIKEINDYPHLTDKSKGQQIVGVVLVALCKIKQNENKRMAIASKSPRNIELS